ncbi:MAG: ADP-ribosylglycohydrolase family protein [Herpetosiphonaceae bacterium]|nr:ADP-ribosylglycohydrolase family protein [Herpetosiphonaceae bacterium]
MYRPSDYIERVYAGVLGKLIGVYLGRPFEGWSYERIMAELGPIHYYVHEQRKVPLVVTDDDIAGTFTFLRALPDYGNRRDLTPAQIGQSWLNYIIEGRTILWWGGMGNSTEHTAYLRLKEGIHAPESGSIALNGKIIAEQIGAQIFIDGWAMVAPGDPELAVDLARRAASVSHDGEAIYGAQVIAAMEAQAFVEADLGKLLDTGVSFIPQDSVIYRLINDIREWHAREPSWQKTREEIAERYGYDKYRGACHMVPNHALIIHALLYGDDDFQKSMMIVNTSGWDTDCNAGNVGCLLGIKNGLAGIEAGPDWRGPVADRLYLSTADGGRAITDAVTETYQVVNIGRALANESPLSPKDGARFHWELPGSVQGFQPEVGGDASAVVLENVAGHSTLGTRSLALRYHDLVPGRAARVATPTFTPPEVMSMPGYQLLASPTLYPGQTVRAWVEADGGNAGPVSCRLYLRWYGADDRLVRGYGPQMVLAPGAKHLFTWMIEDLGGAPVAEIGVELSAAQPTNGVVYLDYLSWDGAPNVVFRRPVSGGMLWRQAWVDGMDQNEERWPEAFHLVQNNGRGLLSQGTREWTNYQVSATIRSDLATAVGIGARVQGMQRYYALLLQRGGTVRLVKVLDGETVLDEAKLPWTFGSMYSLRLQVNGGRLCGWVDDRLLFDLADGERPLKGGGVALICEEGGLATDAVMVQPAAPH